MCILQRGKADRLMIHGLFSSVNIRPMLQLLSFGVDICRRVQSQTDVHHTQVVYATWWGRVPQEGRSVGCCICFGIRGTLLCLATLLYLLP